MLVNTPNGFTYINPVGQIEFTTIGTYTFVIPANVVSISAVAIGGGGGGSSSYKGKGGGGGALSYINNVAVVEGDTLTVTVGSGGRGEYYSYYNGTHLSVNGTASSVLLNGVKILEAGGGLAGRYANNYSYTNATGGRPTSLSGIVGYYGGEGGVFINSASRLSQWGAGGGGAAGYAGSGGNGGHAGDTVIAQSVANGKDGSGGSAGGGSGGWNSRASGRSPGGGGGGVNIYGANTSGSGGLHTGSIYWPTTQGGTGGSHGADGLIDLGYWNGGAGGLFGGGGGGGRYANYDSHGGDGARGAVRIMYTDGSVVRTFPYNAANT